MENFTITVNAQLAVTMRQMLRLAAEMASQQVGSDIPGGCNPEILDQARSYCDVLEAFEPVWSEWRERNPPPPDRDWSEYPWDEMLPPEWR